MTLEEYTEEKIFSDLDKLQRLYNLKRVIRYNQSRREEIQTESVAEHVYGMHLLAQYFLPLEDPEMKMDRARILSMITIHDIDEVDEVENGDLVGYLKTTSMRESELENMQQVVRESPEHMQDSMRNLLDEYESKNTLEAQFVRALDKVEPVVHLSHKKVSPLLIEVLKCTVEQSLSIKTTYIKPFPFIEKFCLTAHKRLEDEGNFWKERSKAC